MAEVADIVGVCILPDQGAVLPHDPSWAGLDTVRTVNVVGTLDAAVWPPACAGDVHVLGQAFWMTLDTLRFLHKLPWLPFQHVALLHTLPAPADVLTGDTVPGRRTPAAFRGAQRVTDVACGLAVILGSVGHDFGFLIGSPKEFFPVYCICVAQVSVAGNDHISIAYFLEGTQSQGCDVQANDRKRKLTVLLCPATYDF